MSLDINVSLIHQKVDEYIFLLKKTGLVTDYRLLNRYRTILHNMTMMKIYDVSSDALVTDNHLEYCSENIIDGMKYHGNYYLDEVFFHEFSHILNSFHQAIRGSKSFIVADAIGEKMGYFTTPELIEQSDPLLYNQDPFLGVLLLDEYVAQNVSQILVKEKYSMLNDDVKKKYACYGFPLFDDRMYTATISSPPFVMNTSLANYPEFDMGARWFIQKYKLQSPYEFVKRAINGDLLRDIINGLDPETAASMYKDLCYLGLIKEAVYIEKGFTVSIDPKDPVNDKSKVYVVLQKTRKVEE